MKKLKKIILLGLCGAVMATSVPYSHTTNINVQAAENVLTVTPKEDVNFFVNQGIDVNQFDFDLNGNTVNTDKIVISPSVFTTSGTKEVTITYDSGSGIYQKKVSIEVQDVVAERLEFASEDITLVKNQTITVASLPDVYLYYNDGTKKVVTDYTTEIDWEKGILTITSNGLTITKNVTIIDSQVSYIQVSAKKSVVPADYIFTPADFVVTAYFTNGMSMEVSDFQILPYTLVDGGETVITIKYITVSSSFIVRGTAPAKTPTPAPTLDPNVTEAPYHNPLGVTAMPSATPITNNTNSTSTTTQPAETNTSIAPSATATPVPTVTEGPTTITLERTSIKQGIGEKVKVNVKTNPKVTVSMKSKNKKIATVTKKGYIKGVSQGTTQIVVTAGISQATINVTVCPAPSKIGTTSTFKTAKYVLIKGKTYKVPIYFNEGAYSNKITFKSSNKKVVSVNQKGQMKAKKVGRAVIRVTSFNKKKASVQVKVIKK